jgi:hypothetical protein
MKKALISPLQPVYDYNDPPNFLGDMVVEVTNLEFQVTPPLFWENCDDTITSYNFYWNQGVFSPVPIPPTPLSPLPPSEVSGNGGPTVI